MTIRETDALSTETASRIKEKLSSFIGNAHRTYLTSLDWLSFYDFIVEAYRAGSGERPSISELASALRQKGFEKPGSLAVLYAHGLYVLARNDDQPIYRGGFNP